MTTNFQIGQQVMFGRPNGEKTLGEVVKINRKTIKVKQLETRGQKRIRTAGTIWTVGKTLATPVTGGVAQPAPKRTEREIVSDISGVFCRLSPENLFCDGERPVAQARRVERTLNRKLNSLFKELGRKMDEIEAYRWLDANKGVACGQ